MLVPRLHHRRAPIALGLVAALAIVAMPASAQSPSPLPSCPPIEPAAAASPDTDAEVADVTVYAAASLRDAFQALSGPWETTHPGSSLVLSFDASSALRAQIEQGAPADVLASADARNAQLLVDACLAPGPITPFAGNALVVVVPSGNPAGIESPADLARPDVRYLTSGPEVPITRYATAAIENLGALPDYPADFVAAVTANIVSEEDNVRAVLAKIELGEGDAAIVYATDAAASDLLETVVIPDEANVPAMYAAVANVDAPQPGLASEFLSFLTGPDAQAVLAGFGFQPAP
jgi:molybdate transport system substrate-binding protein